ncbi:MAG: tetrahydromethanopterin S-methyltransferase subunit H [Candidatus Thorarchaeota archaeon]|nr:MAG: tetrahydromethanopterin S-methyltransferase subunit H [Candidatus Thorarchaeota archaeon]
MEEHPLFDYVAVQKIFEIGGVKIGGLPGLNPTVLVNSIFYSKDKLVTDAKKGEIDKRAAEDVLTMLAGLSEKTGNPTMLDVVASTPEAIVKYLEFLVDATEFPLIIDGSDSPEVNSAGLKYAKESGFIDRAILNSLTPDTKDEFYDIVQESGLENVILLTFNTESMISATKRVEVADDLIQKALDSGIKQILIDTGVLDLPSLGIACKTQHLLKSKYGYPVGNGAHNAYSTWKGLETKFGKPAKKPALVGTILMPVSLGADFVLIGPSKDANLIYPSVAMIDVALSGMYIEERKRPEKPHPRYLIG